MDKTPAQRNQYEIPVDEILGFCDPHKEEKIEMLRDALKAINLDDTKISKAMQSSMNLSSKIAHSKEKTAHYNKCTREFSVGDLYKLKNLTNTDKIVSILNKRKGNCH